MIEIIIEKIKEVAFKKVSNSDDLFASGILTSILAVDLATALEEEFNITIPFTEIILENFSTPESIKNYISTKLK